MKNHLQPTVIEEHVRPVIGLRSGTLRGKACQNVIGKPEQLQALIDEMWTEIVPEAGSGTRLLAPSDADLRSVPIEMRFEMCDVAER